MNNDNLSNIKLQTDEPSKKGYRSILIVAIIAILGGSSIYLATQNVKYKETVKHQGRYIDKLELAAAKTNQDLSWQSIRDHGNSLFGDSPFLSRNWLSNTKTINSDSEFIVKAGLPGFTKEEISIQLSGRTLEIKAESDKQNNPDNDKSENKYAYSVTVPANIDQDNITTEFHNGMLTVKLPKKIQDTSDKEIKKIPIN